MKRNSYKNEYVWIKQSISQHVVTIECPSYHPIKDYRPDPSGIYVLIRPNFESAIIEVAICTKKHEIVAIFKGKKAQDVYEGIFNYEQRKKITWFNSKGHIAYLGKELKKVEFALVSGQNNYFQE